jgi:small-conductance mechanosensitive channel
MDDTLSFLSRPGFLVLASVLFSYFAFKGVYFLAQKFAKQIEIEGFPVFLEQLKLPLSVLFPTAALIMSLASFNLESPFIATLSRALNLALIAIVAWLCICVVKSLEDILASHFSIEKKDNLRARKIHTQLRVVERILVVLIFVIAFATMLMTFEKVRQLGASILASAGVLSIVLGFAARESIATLFAGLQIALTQPIRIDDVVIVENEWGWIEEITLTYVVVKIWDLRRLVVPVKYFLEKPFQNWTRTSADILGTVFIYADYSVPIDAVRSELMKVLEASPLWDKKCGGLQVTHANEKTVELRALMSAQDSSKAWELRCHVREKLITFMQMKYPKALPKVRFEMENGVSLKSDHETMKLDIKT